MKQFLAIIFIVFFTSPVNADLIGYWNFNENGGDYINDQSPFNNDGYASYPKWAVGVSGSALKFGLSESQIQDVPSRVTIPDDQSLSFAFSYSILLWVKIEDINSIGTIVSRKAQVANIEKWGISQEFNRIKFHWHSQEIVTSPLSIGWNHIAVISNPFESQIRYIYLNGELQDNTCGFPCVVGLTHSQPIYVGDSWDGGNPFEGTVDEVYLFNHPLEEEEIIEIMNTFEPEEININKYISEN